MASLELGELHSSELPSATYRALFEDASVALVIVARSGLVLRANTRAEYVFGYPPCGMTDLPVEALVRPGERAQELRDFMLRGAPSPVVSPALRTFAVASSGREFSVEIILSKFRDGAGRLDLLSIRDFSQAQSARYNALVASIGDMMAMAGSTAPENLNQTGSLRQISELVLAELGIDAVAILFRQGRGGGMRLHAAAGLAPALREALPTLFPGDFFPPASSKPLLLSVRHGTLSDAAMSALGDQLAQAGYASLAAVPMINRKEVIGGLVAMARNPAAIDREKTEFLQSVANLLVATVRRSRAEEQIANARRREAVGQLTAGVAHDFNNLLTVIAGNLQMLQSELTRPMPQISPILASALRAVTRGSDLTRKLLAFGRRQSLHPQAISVRRQLADLQPVLAGMLGSAIRIAVKCAPGLPSVFVDPAEFDAMIFNLALNARDAMPSGGELLIQVDKQRIRFADPHGEARPGAYVLISVRDTGKGMSEFVLKHLFEPFFTTKEAGHGNGLGLSMVYGFVKQSGGHLVIDSKPGLGARVDIYLPAVKAQADYPQRPAHAAPAGEGETILVVEDEDDVRAIAVEFLHSLGYVTYQARNAEDALSLLTQHAHIRLLFADVVLGAGMPILLTSGYENPLSQAGAAVPITSPLLRKPYRLEELAVAVRGAIDRSGFD